MDKKILLIDDDKKMSALIKMKLEENNYIVDVAYDGITGGKLALENKYDVIIMDVIMPGIDGFELCKKIRHNVISPILMVTSLDMIEDRVYGFTCGADDYLSKPFQFNDLTIRIDRLINRINTPESINTKF
jgi:DNA-binding response OmpR family regulator